jgi:putative photosynthetic complex assembly protein
MSSDIFAGVPFPHWPLRAAAGMAVFALAITAAARIFGWVPGHDPDTPVRVERDLRFVEHRSGGVDVSAGGIDVIDARTDRKIDELRPGADGFIRATVRGLAQERKRRGLGPEVPFHLALHTDGRLLLVDPALDRTIELEAFGPTNSGAFARLLPAAPPLAAAAPSLHTP